MSVSGVPLLIHVNGPSGAGKSTFARAYADRHPGVLNLDIDQVVSMVGGWREDFWTAFKAGRRLAVGMAETHLRTGHDVVMPQLVTGPHEIAEFEAAAERAGAEYREVVLAVDKQRMHERFSCRARENASELDRRVDEVVARGGGPVLLERIHDQLSAYLETRPEHLVVHADDLGPDETYDAVLALLAQRSPSTFS
ncbi:AAA family ATPase [Allokutzneria sp. NRRL B-24872]|uniref:AAA family ATPase n=1 Tax=Allokutzneria sp. NRRL B-24872 TaxID=1137961 RepID=UPI00143D00F1|nr:AAA family ATPase [Allokutzneria sp. NRRL B-24872]